MGIYRTTLLVLESQRKLPGNVYVENGVVSKLANNCWQ